MQTSKIIIAAALAALSMPATAQSESGLVVEAEAEKRITKDLSLGIGGDFRTRNDFKTIDRWSLGLSLNYKLASWLKADAGYKLLNTNFREDIDYDKSGDYNHWQPSYWGLRHRLYASLTGSYKFGSGIKISLRERWQYTYRPEKTVQRWDFDDEQWEDKVRHGTAKNQFALSDRVRPQGPPLCTICKHRAIQFVEYRESEIQHRHRHSPQQAEHPQPLLPLSGLQQFRRHRYALPRHRLQV